MEGLIVRYRGAAFTLTNVGVWLAVIYGVMAGNGSVGSAVYTGALFTLCCVPMLWLRSFNDRYALAGVFMGTYFLFFGALSLRNLVLGLDGAPPPGQQDSFMTAAQTGVLLGAVLVLVAYRAGSALIRPVTPTAASGKDFSNFTILLIGGSCWTLGSAALAYYAVFVTPENTFMATRRGLESMGPLLTFAVMLGYLIQPLGGVMLAYGYAKNRNAFWLGLVLSMALLQTLLGFIIDTKGIALMGPLLVALTLTLWDNKLSRGWIVGVVAFTLVVFPVMQAERVLRGEHGLNRMQAFERLPEVLARSWESREKINEGRGARPQTFLERSSGEMALEPVFEHAGLDTPFLEGSTLAPLPYAFIPRLLLPDKVNVSPGQLYTKVFLHSSDFTYISFSVLGELYWNFGWAGVVGGMIVVGLILGVVGAKSSLTEGRSITRLLMLLVTVMQLCLGFGGTIATSYTVWMRAMAAIGLMHLILARPASSAMQVAAPKDDVVPAGDGLPLFPNLMR